MSASWYYLIKSEIVLSEPGDFHRVLKFRVFGFDCCMNDNINKIKYSSGTCDRGKRKTWSAWLYFCWNGKSGVSLKGSF